MKKKVLIGTSVLATLVFWAVLRDGAKREDAWHEASRVRDWDTLHQPLVKPRHWEI